MDTELINKPLVEVRGRPMSVLDMLLGMKTLQASDLFLKTGGTVRFKISGRLVSFEGENISHEHMDRVVACFLTEEARATLHERKVADMVYGAPDGSRFRVHFALGQTGPYAAIRLIKQDIQPFTTLGLPGDVIQNMATLRGGLLVVCGTTDAGKTVTCTSMLDAINQSREVAMLTLEDPIEYIFQDKRSMVFQREVGLHTESFASGIRAALRENLDVIFVGEMRGLETIEQVLRAAEMGHLVVSTLHADDVIACISRIVGSFPPEEQQRIRHSLAGVLEGIVFQRLLPKAKGGRVPCVETLFPNTAVRSIIRGGDLTKLGSYLGRSAGNRSFKESLQELLNSEAITRETYSEQMGNLPVAG